MASRWIVGSALALAACVTPARPVAPTIPGPDRFTRAASPDPAVRAQVTLELAYDPSPQAVQLLVVMQARDVDPAVRARASEAIAMRQDPSLDVVLERAAREDPDPLARRAAERAYRELHPWRKSTGWATGLAVLCPGCGHFYLGQSAEGAAYLGSTAALLGGGVALLREEEVSLSGNSESWKGPVGLLAAGMGQNLYFYSIFDAYRDARVSKGDTGYSIAITRETLPYLASAPFRPDVLKSPWVWAGVPAALAAGILVSYALDTDVVDRPTLFDVNRVNFLGRDFSRAAGFGLGELYFGALFTSVGVGEEALFRGVIQTELEERLGTTGGLVTASALFGAVHIPNFSDTKTALVAVPFISLVGATLGLAYIRTGHQLATSVAMHFWYNFLLSTVSFVVDPENQPFVVNHSMTF